MSYSIIDAPIASRQIDLGFIKISFATSEVNCEHCRRPADRKIKLFFASECRESGGSLECESP